MSLTIELYWPSKLTQSRVNAASWLIEPACQSCLQRPYFFPFFCSAIFNMSTILKPTLLWQQDNYLTKLGVQLSLFTSSRRDTFCPRYTHWLDCHEHLSFSEPITIIKGIDVLIWLSQSKPPLDQGVEL